MAQVDTAQQIYQAFGRGDVPAILERLADNVEWEYGLNSTDHASIGRLTNSARCPWRSAAPRRAMRCCFACSRNGECVVDGHDRKNW